MNPGQIILVGAIQVYRWTLSPMKRLIFGPYCACRFEPSCSAYALQAVRHHGAVKGSWLSATRLARCQPWGGSGYDPVPATALQSHK